MTPAFSHQEFQDTCATLSCAGLIRLVGEIDDHGAIPVRGLARILPDLSTHQIRRATEQGDDLGLLAHTSANMGLAAAGQDLADLYDATARWARRHNYPAAHCDFARRIRQTFALLGEAGPDGQAPDGTGEVELVRLHRLMTDWIHLHHPQGTRGSYGFAA